MLKIVLVNYYNESSAVIRVIYFLYLPECIFTAKLFPNFFGGNYLQRRRQARDSDSQRPRPPGGDLLCAVNQFITRYT